MSSLNFLSFCSIAALQDNAELSLSPIGELSNKARAYSKDPNIFRTPNTNTELVNFYGTKDGSYSIMTAEVYEKQIAISDYLLAQANAGKLSDSSANTLQMLSTNFSAGVVFTDVGTMVTNAVVWLPSHVVGTQTLANGDTVAFELWFADAYFLSEYPYCIIEVCLPLPDSNIDILATGNYQQVTAAIAAETLSNIEARVSKIAAGYPYSDRNVYSFLVYDNANNQTVPVYFHVLTYGNISGAEDQIFEAIKSTILKASSQAESVWDVRLPDLFNPLEFTCIPRWDIAGVENKTTATSQYSPIADYESALVHPMKYLASYGNAALIKSTQSVPFLYKSVNVTFVGKPSNRNGIVKIREVYPDYALIPSTDSQAGWMSTGTLGFLEDMQTLIAGAEVLELDGIPAAGIKRLVKDGVLYATMQIGKVKFSMITRSQFVADGYIKKS